MAIKHVKQYYREIENMYLELVSSLNEMEADFKKGEVTEDQLNNLLIPVQGIKENYIRLSYIMHLLFQPQRDSKKGKYEAQRKNEVEFFENNNLTMEQDIKTEKDILRNFKEQLKNSSLFNNKEEK